MSLEYRPFDPETDDVGKLFDLFRASFGSTESLDKRWQWQYLDHPRATEVTILVALDGDRIVGSEGHLPGDLMLKGEKIPAWFASDSMVDPEYRRRGIMENLLELSYQMMPILYAKGTMPTMLKLRMKAGFKRVQPDTLLVCILSPVKFLRSRLFSSVGAPTFDPNKIQLEPEYYTVDRFGDEFDSFFARVALDYSGLVIKNSIFMNWRYTDHPHQQYHSFYRRLNARPVALVVLNPRGPDCHIVDFIWDKSEPSEPVRTIRFARQLMKRAGFTKLYCWSTLSELRSCLRSQRFIVRKETPHFTLKAAPKIINRIPLEDDFHLVDGDGDSNFI